VEKGAHLLSTLGIGDRAHALRSQLSGRQQQRVAIAEPSFMSLSSFFVISPHRHSKSGTKVMDVMSENSMKLKTQVVAPVAPEDVKATLSGDSRHDGDGARS
jgi:ABC-type polar amino acid transport system ATPase subunit